MVEMGPWDGSPRNGSSRLGPLKMGYRHLLTSQEGNESSEVTIGIFRDKLAVCFFGSEFLPQKFLVKFYGLQVRWFEISGWSSSQFCISLEVGNLNMNEIYTYIHPYSTNINIDISTNIDRYLTKNSNVKYITNPTNSAKIINKKGGCLY